MTEKDWYYVCNIYKEALAEGKSTFQTECPTYEKWDAGHLQDCRMVITVGDEIAGWCALSPTSSRDAYRGVAEVSIYVAAKFRSKGLGTALLNKLAEDSRKEGIWCLYAAIFSINEPSIALHKKCGFRVIGYREKIAKDRFGCWQDTTLLEKRNDIR